MRRPAVATRQERRTGYDRVSLHLRRLARRVLNDRGPDTPELGTLRAALEAYVFSQLEHFIIRDEPGDPRALRLQRHAMLGDEAAVYRVARAAARYTLGTWSADYIAEQRRRGAAGGRSSRRGSTWTAAQLDALATLQGLTVEQQAAELKLAPAMVKRMRSALRQRPSPPPLSSATPSA
jgi:hypothetical protein